MKSFKDLYHLVRIENVKFDQQGSQCTLKVACPKSMPENVAGFLARRKFGKLVAEMTAPWLEARP